MKRLLRQRFASYVKAFRGGAIAGILVLITAGCGGGTTGGDDDVTVPSSAPETTAATTPTSSGPSSVLVIVSPATGAVVAGNVVRLDVAGSGLTITPADGDTSGSSGHYHVFVDRDSVEPGAVIPVEEGIIHTTDDPIVIPGLRVGPHRLTVVYGDGAHRRIGLAEAGTSFTITGPSIDASTPSNPASGPTTVTVTIARDGVPADGHVHLFVDREPTPAGQPVPEEPGIILATGDTVPVPDLTQGAHTIWVVAADATSIPLDPPVMDKVTVTIA